MNIIIIDGKRHLHCEDGPAIERANGDQEWYLNDKLHRENGPAHISNSGYMAWYIEGMYHREDGPAREWPHGGKEYWLFGNRIRPEQYTPEYILQLKMIRIIET